MNRIAAHLDGLSARDASEALYRCCACRAWADRMAASRPFGTDARVFECADRIWGEVGEQGIREAFAGHPRIGGRAKAAAHASTAAWSSREQSGMSSASEATARALETGNREYERRFGHVFLICATGKSADEMLASLRDRMGNSPDDELRVAAEQQRLITRIRLGKLVDE